MNFLMVVIAIPLLLNILAVVTYRGIFRVAALLVLPFIAFASAIDFYSALQQGNLTGLLTIVVSGPSLIALLLLGLGSIVLRARRDRSDHSGQTGVTVAGVPGALDQQKGSMAWQTARWATSGALLGAAVSGLIFGGTAAFLATLVGGSDVFSGTEWLQNHSVGHLAWQIGGILGALGGASLN